MPRYPWLSEDDLDFAGIQARVDAMAMLGVPYGDSIHQAERQAREQAREIGSEIVAQGGPAGLENKQIVALTAYLQRLGTDIKRPAKKNETGPKQATARGF
jgi:cytochrome c oxidase cbb3-type subunit I/II